ncbi:hypothetical protein [Polynucleobacter sp. JS-JIR-5-A7]|uniref:hypothetical protein n=1 Tax=Polynucleobacter sp. JS-JIR-5-A7 TaxID=1758395 RepID=UPI001BFDDED8|nr:hypothetical protein [Polynucleobacter sp. JS-JIR-5-A7]QWE06048.1 hypothetical protein AOC29_07975 [Polynucleobacter sp. JS-JIR-5-A7]
MTLYEKILSLYPALTDEDFNSVISLQDDGQGAYVKFWNHPTLARPTDVQLASI